MADIERVMRDTVDLTTEATIRKFNRFNAEMGTRMA